MKTIITVLIFLSGFYTNAQVAVLKVNYPAPRVDQEFDVSIHLQKEKREFDEGKMSAKEFLESRENDVGGGSIKLGKICPDTGLVSIGPFKFLINNVEYVSNTLNVRVYPKLPLIRDGLWVRQVKFNDQEYIIVEQRISSHLKHDHRSSMNFTTEGVKFARLNNYVTRELGFFLTEDGGLSTPEFIDISNVSEHVNYSRTQYKLTRLKWATGNLKFDKGMFQNYPEGVQLIVE